jgi:tripartite-type tricarboxylate transporter receptor subunit TctC
MNRRLALQQAAALAVGSTLARTAWSQPAASAGPLRIIVPWPASGAVDVSVRAGVPALERLLGQSVVVDNRAGGQFQLALQAMALAPADGNTLLHLSAGMVAVQAVQGQYDLLADLIPITAVGDTSMVLMVGPRSPHKTLAELVAHGRANPGALTYATSGQGSLEHLKIAQIEKVAGFQGLSVPFRGGPDMVKALIGGEVDFTIVATAFAAQFAPRGLVRVLAALDERRLPELPEVPTVREAGVNVPPLRVWGGYAVRAGTPAAVVQRLHGALVAAARDPEVAARLAPLGMTVFTSTAPADFSAQIAADLAWMKTMASGFGMKAP